MEERKEGGHTFKVRLIKIVGLIQSMRRQGLQEKFEGKEGKEPTESGEKTITPLFDEG